MATTVGIASWNFASEDTSLPVLANSPILGGAAMGVLFSSAALAAEGMELIRVVNFCATVEERRFSAA